MFLRRLGKLSNRCEYGDSCPQVLETKTGDFAAVGLDIRTEALQSLPPGPGMGEKESAVLIPRSVMLDAMSDLLGTLKSA